MRTPTYHSKELELFCRAENIETPHVYECELDRGRLLRYRCEDCGLSTTIPNNEELEYIKEQLRRRMEE